MGNYYYTQEEAATIQKLVLTLQDAKYPDKVNENIKRYKERLYWIMKSINKNKESVKANEGLRDLFRRWKVEWGGKDNWIAYDIGDKLNKWVGLQPLVKYEEDAENR